MLSVCELKLEAVHTLYMHPSKGLIPFSFIFLHTNVYNIMKPIFTDNDSYLYSLV